MRRFGLLAVTATVWAATHVVATGADSLDPAKPPTPSEVDQFIDRSLDHFFNETPVRQAEPPNGGDHRK